MDPRERRAAVEVPRGLLLGLIGALVAAVAAVGFLIGRESGRGQGPAAAAPPSRPPETLAVAPDEPAPTPETFTEETNQPPIFGERPVQPPIPAAPAPSTPPSFPPADGEPPAAAPAPGADTAQRDAVARYFDEIEAIQSQGKYWSDPQALAKALLQQAAQGDSSEFDRLIAANRQVRDGLRTVTAPPPCEDHHRQTLQLLDDSQTFLNSVRDRILSKDFQALAEFQAEGQEIERRAKQLDALGDRIKARFGLSRAPSQ